jgi:hypothetical protein
VAQVGVWICAFSAPSSSSASGVNGIKRFNFGRTNKLERLLINFFMQRDDTQRNGIQHNGIQHKVTKPNDAQHNNNFNATLRI